jgi:hypothetical protein
MKYFSIALGTFLCLLAIIFQPIAKLTSVDTSRPWVDGLVINVWRAYAKYNTISWITRIIGIFKNPDMTRQYLKILSNKEKISQCETNIVEVEKLIQCHDVQTNHSHHRERVCKLLSGEQIESQFGPIVIVNNIIHDGNHRVAALREANIKTIQVQQWKSL